MANQEPHEARHDETGALRYGHLGIEFALTVGLLAAGGWWLDKKLETTPLFSFIGLMAGFGLGFWRLYKGAFSGPTAPRDPGG